MFDWLIATMAQGGYLALGALMFAENLFPPIPSEVVMPFGGFLAAQGRFTFPMVVLVGTAGSVAGATFWYYVGLWLGAERVRRFAGRWGRWLTISPEDVDRANAWFVRHGASAVFFGRFLPGVRTLISVPAGIVRMPLLPFLAYTTAGSLIWIGGLAALGWVLEANYDRVVVWLDPLTWVVIGAIAGAYAWRVVRQARR